MVHVIYGFNFNRCMCYWIGGSRIYNLTCRHDVIALYCLILFSNRVHPHMDQFINLQPQGCYTVLIIFSNGVHPHMATGFIYNHNEM